MAKEHEETVEHDEGPVKKKVPSKKIVSAVIVVLLISGGVFGAWKFMFSKGPTKLDKSALPFEVLTFVYNRIPELYSSLKDISEESVMTEMEIARIAKVGEMYPDQKVITDNEKRFWEVNMMNLAKGLENIERNIQTIYVLYQVNPESGQKMMDDQKETLRQAAETLVVNSKILTDKLRANKKNNQFFQRMMFKYFKKVS